VDRDAELALVLDKVRALLSSNPVARRTTAFYGPRGSGKSWLICEIAQRLIQEEPFRNRVQALYLALGSSQPPSTTVDSCPIANAANHPEQDVQRALAWCGDQLGLDGSPAALPLDSLSAQVAARCALSEHPVIVLADGIDEAPPEFLRLFETYLLAPLVVNPRVLVVLGGRTRDPRPGGGYAWKMPELKLNADLCDLAPFNEEWVHEQLARLEPDGYPVAPSAASEVRRTGGGYPLSNVMLAPHIEGDPPQWRDKGKALKSCAEEMLEGVPPELRDPFWALSVLRAFDEDRMPAVLSAWYGDDPTLWDYQRCRRIREDMAAPRLARWQGERGFVMDDALREALHNALRENQRERWRALHQAAYNLYAAWVERYPKARARWQPEVDYHAGCLQEE